MCVTKSPPAKKPITARREGSCRSAKPMIAWPDVQPPEYLEPKPTRNPPRTIMIRPVGVSQPGPTEYRGGNQIVEIRNPELGKIRPGCLGDRDGIWISEPGDCHESTDSDSKDERQVPRSLPLPIVLEERNIPGIDRRADVAEILGNAEHFPTGKQEKGHHEADERACDVPRPWLREKIDHQDYRFGW